MASRAPFAMKESCEIGVDGDDCPRREGGGWYPAEAFIELPRVADRRPAFSFEVHVRHPPAGRADAERAPCFAAHARIRIAGA